ncbi:acyltransferase [Lysobacter sp. A3-1-A15]|uniref:acyltransferase n=1 Tax=Novilysobacter viscosus TaxID=3098602 RepID=UPI002EDA8F63
MHSDLPTCNPPRRHDIDALRVLAFVLLILYHVGMFYVADWGWHAKSSHVAEWLKWPMLVVNQWRMPLIFLISGLAVHFLLRRVTPGAFAWSRVRRLLLPLAFGMAVVVPPQAYVQALSTGAFEGSYLDFLVRYFTFQPWPVDAFDGWEAGITWNHLWYLPYLLVYSLLLAAALPLLRSRVGRAFQGWVQGLRGVRLWLLPALPLTLATWTLSAAFPTTHDLLNDWHTHAQSLAMFMLGYWIGTDPGAWAELRRRRWTWLGAALSTFALFTVLLYATEPGPTVGRALYDFVQRLNQWTWLLLVLGWGHHLLDRPFRWMPWASASVYPWYVLHQSITVVAGFYLARLSLGPVIEPVLVLLATGAGCVLLTDGLVRHSAVLRLLMGMPTRPTAGPSQPAGVAKENRTGAEDAGPVEAGNPATVRS